MGRVDGDRGTAAARVSRAYENAQVELVKRQPCQNGVPVLA
jgi:hypothetical protein